MKKFSIIYVLFIACVFVNYAQDEDIYEELLKEVVEVENPVYKPVIAGGIGLFGYIGDIKNNQGDLFFNKPGYKINVSTYVDNKHWVRANFFFLMGSVTANERSYLDTARNFNFQSDIIDFGVNLEYGFGNFVKGNRRVTPFISVGIEIMQFGTKTDMYYRATAEDVAVNAAPEVGSLVKYNYWTDGTIRNLPQTEANLANSRIVPRDFIYETDMREELDWGDDNNYQQNAISIPVDLGLDFAISNRFTVRLGTSIHYTFTDYFDHLTPQNTRGYKANNLKDIFTYTYVTLHLDLFSEAKTYTVDKLFADIEFDYTLFEDEDNDMVFDHADECPGTPLNVPVDSVGCPFDDDYDGVPNYMDKEPDTRMGAFVNSDGIEMTEDELLALLDNSSAVARKDIDLYIQKISDITYSRYYGVSNLEIPKKFLNVDKDGDGYISFDEVLDSIDDFFDFKSNLTSDDIYELNEFFFAQ